MISSWILFTRHKHVLIFLLCLAAILQWRQLVSNPAWYNCCNTVRSGFRRRRYALYYKSKTTASFRGIELQEHRLAGRHHRMYFAQLRGPHSVGPSVNHFLQPAIWGSGLEGEVPQTTYCNKTHRKSIYIYYKETQTSYLGMMILITDLDNDPMHFLRSWRTHMLWNSLCYNIHNNLVCHISVTLSH
jgi:hypothetical protein